MPEPLIIPRSILDRMVEHCLRESPLEACGILGGANRVVASFHPLSNASKSESRYDADPNELIRTIVHLRETSSEISAIYHSHPKWPAIPSKTDLRENHYGHVPRIIVSLKDAPPTVRIWRLDPDSYEETPWTIDESR